MDNLHDLLLHMAWADSVHWREVLAHPNARRSKALHARLHHLHLVQTFYAQFLLGREPFLTEPRNFRSAKDLGRYARKAHDQLAKAWEANGEQLDRRIQLPHLDPPCQPTRTESFLQVILHSAHHRGQTALHLRRLKIEPETVDYILWVWKGRPEADWSFLDS
jgi:uncharacterized damage-inducible protein DinB